MKKVAIVILLSVCINVSYFSDTNNYSKKYDHIHLSTILGNRRLVNLFAMCFLGKAACSPDGKELKRIIPDALKNGCQKCTNKQKHFALQMINVMQKNNSDLWSQLQNLWDPTGELIKNFKHILANDIAKVSDNDNEPYFNNIDNPKTSSLPSSSSSSSFTPLISTTTATGTVSNKTDIGHTSILNPLLIVDKISKKILRTSNKIAVAVLNGFDEILQKKKYFVF